MPKIFRWFLDIWKICAQLGMNISLGLAGVQVKCEAVLYCLLSVPIGQTVHVEEM